MAGENGRMSPNPPPRPHQPSLTRREVAGQPRGAVLLLHGGAADSRLPVDGRSTSWWRAAVLMNHIARRAHSAGLTLWLLRYRVRGWNGGTDSVLDARWALDELRREHGPLPVVLLGHSMGARTAVAVADHPDVAGVVALAPWLPATEPVDALAGKHLVAAHGSLDRITSAQHTRQFVRRARPVAASAEYVDMGPVGHYMLRRMRAWNDLAVSRASALVEGGELTGDRG